MHYVQHASKLSLCCTQLLQDSVQDAASFNYDPSSRAQAQKCLLHSFDEDPTSVLPAQAVIELSEGVQQDPMQSGMDAQPLRQTQHKEAALEVDVADHQRDRSHEQQDELPTSTTASVDQPREELSQSGQDHGDSDHSLSAHDDPQLAARDSATESIPMSSSAAAMASPPDTPVALTATAVADADSASAAVAPAVAHPESRAAKTHNQQPQKELLDSAMDIRPAESDYIADRPETIEDGTVSDAATLAASHAVAANGVQERGVRTAAAAAAAALAPEVDAVMWPALMRQEAEGGVLLIEALKRSLQSGGG